MRRRLALHVRHGGYARAVARTLPPRTDHVMDAEAAHRWLDLADRYDALTLFTDPGTTPELEDVFRRAWSMGLAVQLAEITPRLDHVA